MQCVAINEFDQVVAVAGETCSFVLVNADDFLASASLQPEDIASSFSWGFGVVITLWFLAYCVKAATKTIKLL